MHLPIYIYLHNVSFYFYLYAKSRKKVHNTLNIKFTDIKMLMKLVFILFCICLTNQFSFCQSLPFYCHPVFRCLVWLFFVKLGESFIPISVRIESTVRRPRSPRSDEIVRFPCIYARTMETDE